MATVSQILTDRATAGARYAAAVVELKAAYVGLAAIDMALGNANVPTPTAQKPVRRFGEPVEGTLDALPPELVHPVYVPARTFAWRKDIIAAAEPIINAATA